MQRLNFFQILCNFVFEFFRIFTNRKKLKLKTAKKCIEEANAVV